MRNTQPPAERRPTALGLYLLRAMTSAGFSSQAEFARAANLSKSTINRLIFDDGKPDPDTLGALAEALDVDPSEVFAAAGYGQIGEAPAPRVLHPLAVELDLAIGEGSTLPAEDRQRIADMVEYVLRAHRKRTHRRTG